jgi:Superfamily I DNA and RNA helicases
MSTWLLPRSELTSEQLRAVELSPLSHQVIFGAPGSGKTQILLHRAAFLRNHLGTKPNRFRIFVYRKNAVKPCTLGQGYKAHAVLSSQTCDKIAV